jgi:hypothetical protein
VRKGSWDKQSNNSPDNELNLIDEKELDSILLGDLIGLDGDEDRYEKNKTLELNISSIPVDKVRELGISINETK